VRIALVGTLQHWQRDPDFSAVREREGLARLPARERNDWQRLWADVEALLVRTRDQK
jgi:hypothetical protein